MAPRPRGPGGRRGAAARGACSPAVSLAIWALVALAWRLDLAGPHVGQHAAVFSAIVSAISWLSGALATAAEATAAYLATAVSWLGTHLASLMTNTGSMFSKVWEGAKIVYSDVVKPALQWLHDAYERIKTWMTDVFGPVLKWANRVRDELQSLYKRFVAPILKILDTSRAVLDILAKLHVPFAAALENVVNDVEQTIAENYLRLLGYVNKAISTLNGFFTLDGLLQRFVLLRSIERDAFYIWRVMVNTSLHKTSGDEQYLAARATLVRTVPEVTDDMLLHLMGQESDIGPVVEKYGAAWGEYFAGGTGEAETG